MAEALNPESRRMTTLRETSRKKKIESARLPRGGVPETFVPSSSEQSRHGNKYVLDAQVGFLLRQVNQRHTAIFASEFKNDLTTTQWAVLAKIAELGPRSQNSLGRATAMDVATIKGVVDRLIRRALVELRSNPDDARQLIVALTLPGQAAFEAHLKDAFVVTEKTLAPLTRDECRTFIHLLHKLR
jgi:DNA-binding MarR family transcriptional regulator